MESIAYPESAGTNIVVGTLLVSAFFVEID